MKKLFSVLLVMVVIVSMAACGKSKDSGSTDSKDSDGKEKYVIGFSCANNANEANVDTMEAMEAAIKAQSDVEIELMALDGENVGENQVAHCETFISKKVDCVIVQPCDAAACQTGVEACIEAGIPVFTIGAKIEDNSICPYVGQDSKVAGEMEMQYIADLLDGKGNIVVIEGPTGNSDTLLRTEGIKNIVGKYEDIQILASQPGNWLREEGMALTETWLQGKDEIAAVVAENDEMALGAYDAISDAGKQDDILVIGIDAISAAKESVKNGEMVATVLQDTKAIGEKAIDVAMKAFKGETLDDVYEVKPVLLTKENVEDYMN